MKFFLAYIKSKAFVFCFMAIAIGLFLASFMLYHLPPEAVLYPSVLVFLIGFAFLLADYLRTRIRCRELQRLSDISAKMLSDLPEAATPTEAAWAQLVKNIRDELLEAQAAAHADYQDMVDYYTVWAHQIKTPIASMKLTLQNEDSELSRQLRSDLFRTQQYADMVLAFLRLGSDSTDYVFRRVRLDDVIRPSVRKFAPEFIRRKLSLRYEPVQIQWITDEKWLAFVL